MQRRSFARYAWFVLLFNIAVVIWGAYVRASGSGAGCGNHWPLCNGVLVPAAQRHTLIEFSHRASSGVAVILTAFLTFLAFRIFPKRDPVRRASAWALAFELMEILIGASLVLLGHVGANQSIQRGYSLSVHLTNTFLLLASLAITAYLSTRPELPSPVAIPERRPVRMRRFFIATAIGILIIGITGAIAALGDTLFVSSSLAEGMRQDFSIQAHPFVRARIFHPVIAVLVGVYVLGAVLWVLPSTNGLRTPARTLGYALLVLIAIQFCIGAMNVLWLAPVPVQLVHLFFADLLWITFVLFSTEMLLSKKVA